MSGPITVTHLDRREFLKGDPVPCPDCGCKVIRGAHYGAFEACNRIKTLKARLARAMRAIADCPECREALEVYEAQDKRAAAQREAPKHLNYPYNHPDCCEPAQPEEKP